MQHRANLMMELCLINTPSSEDVWFVNSGASNHITSHAFWFQELLKPNQPIFVETGDDTIHPIQHVGNVPFGKEGNQTYIKNVLHVSTIMENLVSVGRIVEQGMQVRFNDGGCFIEKEGW